MIKMRFRSKNGGTMKPQFILMLCGQNNDSYTDTDKELTLCLCASIGLHSFTGQSEINKKFTVNFDDSDSWLTNYLWLLKMCFLIHYIKITLIIEVQLLLFDKDCDSNQMYILWEKKHANIVCIYARIKVAKGIISSLELWPVISASHTYERSLSER